MFARHVNPVTSVSDARLKETIHGPAGEQELDEFVEFDGDCFISRLVEGGEHLGVSTFYSQTTEEQKEVVQGLSAAGIINGVSVGTDLQKAITTFARNANVNCSFRQQISGH